MFAKVYDWKLSRARRTRSPVVELGAHVEMQDGRSGVVVATRAVDGNFDQLRVLPYADPHGGRESPVEVLDPASAPV